jgi:hypothetical protein
MPSAWPEGPLRPPLRMRLDIDRWSPSSTALELIPRRRVQPTATYFRAGHRLLDSLTHSLQHQRLHNPLSGPQRLRRPSSWASIRPVRIR